MAEEFSILVDKAFNYDEILQRQKLNHDDVVALRKIAKDIPAVPRLIFDKQLVLFTCVAGGDINKAASFLQRFYEIKQSSPALFGKRDPESKSIQHQMEIQEIASLPITQDNCFVFIHRVLDFPPREYNYNVVYRMFMMMAEASIYKDGPRDGVIFVSDWKNVKFAHLFRPGIKSLKVMLDFLRNANPLPLKAVHVFNASYLVQVLIAMVRPLMWSELFDMIHVHSGDTDYKDFFHQHIPRSHMPQDYGGDLPTLKELHEKTAKNLLNMRDYFCLEERHMMHEFDDFKSIDQID
ncbi:hypothetical protein PVAND_000298 [Polypedilum vanderplanki]|uniref:CRAL-TRIO domain-containing protein n=1 Tax=Polypedilum vanderplanki TaxID=319348 RepID=A0A9J6BKI5_POLVA|nr:hypothetical protein PVAND_000298 [Polypedilum vanderplanki]